MKPWYPTPAPNYGAGQSANAKHLKSEILLESHFPCKGLEKPQPELLEMIAGSLQPSFQPVLPQQPSSGL